ncbi:hypothetical protein L2E82_51779 [Cichorium intybus]|nr:hypothetical protein L2E82_51779 [Cichorium intybus]
MCAHWDTEKWKKKERSVKSFFDLISLSPHSTPDSLPTPAAAPSRSTSSIAALFFNLAAACRSLPRK